MLWIFVGRYDANHRDFKTMLSSKEKPPQKSEIYCLQRVKNPKWRL